MSDQQHDDHGKSVAAWTGVYSLILGSALISVGVYFGAHLWTILGVVVCAVGLIGAIVLSKAGFGVAAKRQQAQGQQGVR